MAYGVEAWISVWVMSTSFRVLRPPAKRRVRAETAIRSTGRWEAGSAQGMRWRLAHTRPSLGNAPGLSPAWQELKTAAHRVMAIEDTIGERAGERVDAAGRAVVDDGAPRHGSTIPRVARRLGSRACASPGSV